MYAIRTVGSVLAPYDTDQRYPCFGFGAKLPPYSQVSHCFALNGNENDPEVTGVDVSYSHTHCVLMLSSLYVHTCINLHFHCIAFSFGVDVVCYV